MAGDERIKDFTDEVAVNELQALLTTLFIGVDASGFSDAKKVLWKTLLFNSIINEDDNNTIAHLAITPKAFYDSVMTESKRGVGAYAPGATITAKTGSGLIRSSQQTLMQTQWWKDWFQKNGVATLFAADNIATPTAMAFDFFLNNTFGSIFSQDIIGSLTLPRAFKSIAVQCSVLHGVDSASKFITLEYLGVEIESVLIPGKLNLVIGGNGNTLRLSGVAGDVQASLKVTAIITG